MRGGRGCQTAESVPNIRIVVNGEQREVAAGLSLAGLVRALGLEPSRLAVEHNRKIIRRQAWAEAPVADGDRLEIVQFVGGGCLSPIDMPGGSVTIERPTLKGETEAVIHVQNKTKPS